MALNSFTSYRSNNYISDNDDSDDNLVESSFINDSNNKKQKNYIVIDSSEDSYESDCSFNIIRKKKTRNVISDDEGLDSTLDDGSFNNPEIIKENTKIIISNYDVNHEINSSQSTINTDDDDGKIENHLIVSTSSNRCSSTNSSKLKSPVNKNHDNKILISNDDRKIEDHLILSTSSNCRSSTNSLKLKSSVNKNDDNSILIPEDDDEEIETDLIASSSSNNHQSSSNSNELLIKSPIIISDDDDNNWYQNNISLMTNSIKPPSINYRNQNQHSDNNSSSLLSPSESFSSQNSINENNNNFVEDNSNEYIQNLKAEKIRLEYEIKNVNEGIKNKTITLNSVNLNVLPDKGARLKVSLAREKRSLDELDEQLNRVNNKLLSISNNTNNNNIMPKIGILPSVNIQDMGKKALETHSYQQSLTVDSLRKLHNSLNNCPSDDKILPDPNGLKISLMPHQRNALTWLLWREKEIPSGGILADDMGLGKTLTMISLILEKENKSQDDEENGSSEENCDDEDDIEEERNHYSGGTLVVCPASLIGQWELEIKHRVKSGLLSYDIYHGQNREKKPRRLAKHQIVITSYSIVRVEISKSNNKNIQSYGKKFGPLFQVKWKRIILDEAHNIRNHKSQTAIAVFNLKSKHRWALTGTPVHNKTQDFFALIKFLRCKPFDDINVWKKWVEAKDESGNKRLNMLTKSLMLRRTKDVLMSEGKLDSLPEKILTNINVHLDKNELSLYEKVLNFSKTLLYQFLCQKAEKDKLLNNGMTGNKHYKHANIDCEDYPFKNHPVLDKLYKKITNMNNNVKTTEILVLLLRLRQICCHPSLMKSMIDKEGILNDGINDEDGSDLDLLEKMSSMTVNEGNDNDDDEEEDEMKDVFNQSHPIFKPDWPSSKIRAILQLLEDKLLQTDDKVVIVSQWTSMLELLYNFIKKLKNNKCQLLTGKVPVDQRMNIVNDFNNNKSKLKILLLSLTAGGTGLNLVGGNHLILTDLHWNPQLEAQACDRIYRVGQNKLVNIYKFVCVETIEERIQELQKNKLALADDVLSGSKQTQVTKLSLNDLKMLFNFI